jgi:hypothetical protein
MLIPPKSVVYPTTELGPGSSTESVINGLQPPSSCILEVHSGYPNPNTLLNAVHIKVNLATRLPQLQIIAVKLREIHFWQSTQWCSTVITRVGGEMQRIRITSR